MDKDKIRFCLRASGRLLAVFAISLPLLFAAELFEIRNIYIVIILAFVSTATLFFGMAMFIFGFLMPILFQHYYREMMTDYQREHFRESTLWKFILNLPR